MPRTQTFVIVGASLAGAKAAETLRTEGFDGRVVLIGEEPERPYERPHLSKGYLRGEADRRKIFVHDDTFYADQSIELRVDTRVTSVQPEHHTVVLNGDERVHYDRLLLTTGASPRRLHVPGADLAGVHYLRSLADADRLAGALRDGDNVAVIGAGFIGAEVAASARQLGRNVAMIDPADVPLQRVLGPEVGAVYRNLHADHRVNFHPNTGVESLRGNGHVEAVHLTDESTIPADLVIVGVGALPRVELAALAGIAVDGGIVVDAHLRTSAPDIFAAGDAASAFHPLLVARVRVEHWANALHQGPAAAKNMLGVGAAYDRIPYFYSDQYELGMEYFGYAPTWDRVVFRGDPGDGKFVAFWLENGHVVAGMGANVWDLADPIQHMIRERVAPDTDLLADPETSLDTLTGDPAH
jgi:3-phenylpropionate/trans-cinnamate dioxygenase ferredoxin reductase subunit